MAPLFALIVAFSAIATTSAVPIDRVNVIDPFQPIRMADLIDRYWTNPSYHRYYWTSPFNREYYNTFNYKPRTHMTFREFAQHPIFIITPSADEADTLSLFFLSKGLTSLYQSDSFAYLQKYFLTPGLKGLAFFPQTIYTNQMLETPLKHIFTENNFKVRDFLMLSKTRGDTPVLFVAPEAYFDKMQFNNIFKVSDLKVHNNLIDIIPLEKIPHPSQPQQINQHIHSEQSSQFEEKQSQLNFARRAENVIGAVVNNPMNIDGTMVTVEPVEVVEQRQTASNVQKNVGSQGLMSVLTQTNLEDASSGNMNAVPSARTIIPLFSSAPLTTLEQQSQIGAVGDQPVALKGDVTVTQPITPNSNQ